MLFLCALGLLYLVWMLVRCVRFLDAARHEFARSLRCDTELQEAIDTVIKKQKEWDKQWAASSEEPEDLEVAPRDLGYYEAERIFQPEYGRETCGPFICDIVSEWLDSWAKGNTYDEDRIFRRWDDTWGARVRCCLRAGLDCAVPEIGSTGVIGFHASDLRRMWRGSVPDWVMGTEPLHVYENFRFSHVNGTFSSVPDNAAVWL